MINSVHFVVFLNCDITVFRCVVQYLVCVNLPFTEKLIRKVFSYACFALCFVDQHRTPAAVSVQALLVE